MSVTSQGHGWWLASDGKWYPPQQPGEMHDFDDGNGPVLAHRHPNGDGWVANTSLVADTAFVGPDAAVFGYARVLESAAVTGTAWVLGAAEVSGSARIAGDAEVGEHARVSGTSLVTDDARVAGDALITDGTIVSGKSWVTDGTPKGPDWWIASDGNWYPPIAGPTIAVPGTTVPLGQLAPPAVPAVGAAALEKPKFNDYAIACVVCGVLAVIPILGYVLAVASGVFGVAALRQIHRSNGAEKGTGIAVIGMILALVLLITGEALAFGGGASTPVAVSQSPGTTAPVSTVPAPPPTTTPPATRQPPATTQPPPVSQIGLTVKDGDFAFVVQSFTCGASAAAAVSGDGSGFGETIPAGAQECLATMTVSNDKGTAQTFFASNQYAYDASNHQFSADTTGSIYISNSNYIAQVNPGVSITAVVPFQIPQTANIVSLELHDSAYSGGVGVKL